MSSTALPGEGPRPHPHGVGAARLSVPRRARCRRRPRRSARRRPDVAHATVRRPRRRPPGPRGPARHPARAAAARARQAQRRDRHEGTAWARRCSSTSSPWADVLVENYRPGRDGRPRSLAATCSPHATTALVHCSITGYGHDGPYRDRPRDGPRDPGDVGLHGQDRVPRRAAGEVGSDDRRRAPGRLRRARRARRAAGTRPGRPGPFVDLSMFDALLTILWDEPIDHYEDAAWANGSGTPIRAPAPSARSRPPTATSRWCSRATTNGNRCASRWHGPISRTTPARRGAARPSR